MLQREEKIVVVLLLMALGSLYVASWMFSEYDEGLASGSSGKDSGLSFEGTVKQVRETATGGNLIISLNSTTMPVFVPSSSGAEKIKSLVHAGDDVKVRGVSSEYNGVEEIKVERASDLEVVKKS